MVDRCFFGLPFTCHCIRSAELSCISIKRNGAPSFLPVGARRLWRTISPVRSPAWHALRTRRPCSIRDEPVGTALFGTHGADCSQAKRQNPLMNPHPKRSLPCLTSDTAMKEQSAETLHDLYIDHGSTPRTWRRTATATSALRDTRRSYCDPLMCKHSVSPYPEKNTAPNGRRALVQSAISASNQFTNREALTESSEGSYKPNKRSCIRRQQRSCSVSKLCSPLRPASLRSKTRNPRLHQDRHKRMRRTG